MNESFISFVGFSHLDGRYESGSSYILGLRKRQRKLREHILPFGSRPLLVIISLSIIRAEREVEILTGEFRLIKSRDI